MCDTMRVPEPNAALGWTLVADGTWAGGKEAAAVELRVQAQRMSHLGITTLSQTRFHPLPAAILGTQAIRKARTDVV